MAHMDDAPPVPSQREPLNLEASFARPVSSGRGTADTASPKRSNVDSF